MSVYIFAVDPDGDVVHRRFTQGDLLKQGMEAAEWFRKNGHSHVSISYENENLVGKPGVAAVENGKTPDGEAYEWSKAGRAGKMRR
jgi:hypothetical protein